MSQKNLAHLRNGILGILTFTVVSSYSQEYEVRENYVELGKMRGQSSFQEVSPSEVSETFNVPVYKKSDYKDRVVGEIRDSTDAMTQKKKKKKITNVALEKLKLKLKKLRITPLPKFRFGKEQRLKRKNIGWSSANYKEIKSYKLNSVRVPNVLKDFSKTSKINFKKASLQKINLKNVGGKVVTSEDVNKVQFKPESNFQFKEEGLFLKQPKDLELLAVDILFEEKESCVEVVPLTEYLNDKVTKDNRVNFYRGMCLHDNKMFSESIPLLSEVIGTSSLYYSKKAVGKILSGLPKGYESIISKNLAPKNVYSKLEESQKNKYNYILAKGYFINDNFRKSEGHAALVTEKSPAYFDAQFIIATSQYMSGRLKRGIQTLAGLKEMYFKRVNPDKDFQSLISVTLGRFLFERGAYSQAIKEYEGVSRNHPLWIDSLIEKGWAQIKVKDYAAAIGNMYTLQSPLFKDAFVPEAHVIRTIGYLNLCQFGDANASLSVLETKFPEERKQIISYMKSKKPHHKTLTNYLSLKDKNKVSSYDDIPASIIREMGRDRNYLVTQTKLNNIVDEIPMFQSFAKKVFDKREDLITSRAKVSEKIKSLKIKEAKAIKEENIELAKNLKSKRKEVFFKSKGINYRIDIFNKGVVAYKKANGDSIKRAQKFRDDFLLVAENNLRTSMGRVDSRLELVLRNNDLLRYEVFAGSGKNIRYRVAGGKTRIAEGGGRAPASIKGKDYNWKFKGEFWEDEIGKFSSQLKNLCPKK